MARQRLWPDLPGMPKGRSPSRWRLKSGPVGVWRSSIENPACRPCHRPGVIVLADGDLPAGSGPRFGLAPCTGDKRAGSHHCALPGLAAPGASGIGWLPCGAVPAVPPCLLRLPGRDPAGGGQWWTKPWLRSLLAFGASRPESLSPPAVW